jgi:hypothetical protein
MSKKADKFIDKYIVGKDDWLLKHKEVISKLLDEYEREQLTLTDVVKCNCKRPRPQMKVSENGISGYCANCTEPL